jgi:hypothetical protein
MLKHNNAELGLGNRVLVGRFMAVALLGPTFTWR